MAAKSEEQIIRSRLIVEDRPLRRCLRHLSIICGRYNQLSPEETQAACERVVQEVRWFRHSVNVAVQSQKRGAQETCLYNDYHAKLEREVADIDTEIKRLNEDLEVSRNNKRHKIAYDEIAIEANKLPTRERLSADISTITSEIEQLRQEEVTHNAILESLRVQYSAVVDEMKRLESMSKSALSMQDLGIYLGDMEEEDRGSGEPGGHSFLGISPTTPHPPGDPHGDFGTPIDNSVLDDDGNDHNGSEDSPNKHAKKNEEEAEAEAEDGDYTNDDIEDGEDSGHHHATHMVDILGAESNADAIDSEEEGECEDEEGELIV